MKQVMIEKFGGAEVLKVVDAKRPQPGPGEVLIKVAAAGVNYSDILRRRNTYFLPTPLPFVPGAEAAGTIEALGEGVNADQLQVGSRVLGALPAGGGYSEYVVANAQFCIPLPPHIPFEVATGIFVQGSTAHLMLHTLAGDVSGKTILIHAASGGVGSLLVQLGKMAGATVIAATSSPSKIEKAILLGADAGVNYTEPGWTEAVINANGGKKVDIIFEMVGGEIFSQALQALRLGGTMIVYGEASGKRGMIHSEHFADTNHILKGFNLGITIEAHPDVWQHALGGVIQLLAEGNLKVLVEDKYSLADVAQAHTDIEQRRTSGKVVLIP